jgi:hypothetical protein
MQAERKKETMNLILYNMEDLKDDGPGRVICEAPKALFTSMKALRMFLSVYASRQWGKVEGRDWTIRNYPERFALCPLYAAKRDGQETLEIK